MLFQVGYIRQKNKRGGTFDQLIILRYKGILKAQW